MIYALDFEFVGQSRTWLSMGLVRPDGKALYLVNNRWHARNNIQDEWVKANVLDKIDVVPDIEGLDVLVVYCDSAGAAKAIEDFLKDDKEIIIIADWPIDINYFHDLIITAPGKMIDIGPAITYQVIRIDPPPISPQHKHHALYDAASLLIAGQGL